MQIADEAEDLAQLWGTRAGFLVNPVRRDRAGWDHLFEMSIPREPRPSDPFGLPACAFTCRVQVKSATCDQRSIPIKLTNWKRAVQDPLPWFLLLIRFDRGAMREAVLVHLGETLVERVIAKLYTLPADAKTQLHLKTHSVRWNDGEVLKQPVERSLFQAITRAIGDDAFEYAKTKQGWYENAGYKDKSALDVTMALGPFKPDELCRRLARAAVGLDGLESSQVSLSRERFGRAEPLQVRGSVTAKVNWGESTGRQLMLNVHDSDGTHLTTLPVWTRSSTSVFPLPREFWLLRFESLMIDMQLDVGANHCKVNLKSIEDTEPVSLKALNDDLAFLKCLDDRQGQTLELSLSRNHYSAVLARVTAPATLGRSQYQLATDSVALWSLLGHLGAADATVRLTPKAVADFGYAARVMLMGRGGGGPDMFLDFSASEGEVDLTRPLTIVTSPCVKIGAITYMDLVALTAVPTALPQKNGTPWVRVVPEQCKILLSRRYVGDQVRKFDFPTVALSSEAELSKSGAEHAIGIDWRSFTEETCPQTA